MVCHNWKNFLPDKTIITVNEKIILNDIPLNKKKKKFRAQEYYSTGDTLW